MVVTDCGAAALVSACVEEVLAWMPVGAGVGATSLVVVVPTGAIVVSTMFVVLLLVLMSSSKSRFL